MNLILIGFMGTGKTTIGRKAAKGLRFKFTDTDKEIEQVCGMTITQIFKKCGEVRFRSEEKAAIKRVTQESNQVIATGGGVVLDPENIEMLKGNGIIICLTAPPDVIFQRISQNKSRPLLRTEDPLGTITKMLQERQPLYQCADFTVETSARDSDDVTAEVVRRFRERLEELHR